MYRQGLILNWNILCEMQVAAPVRTYLGGEGERYPEILLVKF